MGSQKKTLSEELEAVFRECQENIEEAIEDYEREVHLAIEELKMDLSRNS